MTKQCYKWKKRITAFTLVLALLLSMVPASMSSAAKKVSLAKKTMKIQVGKSKKLKLKNNKKKVIWKVVSGKKNVKLKSKKKTGVTIVAKKKGKAKVQAKIGKKKYTCKVTVIGKSSSGSGDDDIPGTEVSADPDATADVTASGQPSETTNPDGDQPTKNPGSSNQPDQPTQNPASSNQPDQPTQNPVSSNQPDQPTQNPVSSDQPSQPTQNPESSSQPSQPTQNPGGEIDLGSKTVFNIGSAKIALGISKAEVLTAIGSGSTLREERAPQGFDTIVYNPGGSYNGYTLIYLKDNAVVSICSVGTAGTVSYGDLVKTGEEASTLAGKGWSGESWFAAKDGQSIKGQGAYKYTDSNGNATVLAYVDYHRTNGNKVYGIQVYSNKDSNGNAISFDDMTKPAKCTYDDGIVAAMETQTTELLIAYRTSCGYLAAQYPLGQVITLKSEEGLATAARAYLKRCLPGSDTPPNTQTATALKTAIMEQNQLQGQDAPMHFAQITMAGCADSIGFANFIIDQKESIDYIIKLSYAAQRQNSTYYKYCYQYLGVAAAGETENYACMVIDLVDRWKDSDPNWYSDDDDDDGWE